MGEFHLETERLIIRNWREEDRDLFYRINSDDRVMALFPFRRDRKAANKMMNDLRSGIEKNGYGLTAIALKEDDRAIGFCGLIEDTSAVAGDDIEIEIGWRLVPEFWGKGYATEAALRLLEFGFRDLGLKKITSFAVHNNHRSFAVMERIGMKRDEAGDFDHERVPDSHPHLKRHLAYELTREDYFAQGS